MLARLWALTAFLALACGGADNQSTFDQPVLTGGAGTAAGSANVAGSSSGGADAVAGQATGGSATAGAASAGTTASAGVEAGGSAGAPVASGGAGGAQQGGTASGGAGSAGQAQGGGGAAQAGAAGMASDPLEPKPVPGCPGYVEVLVPHGTCVWFHGTFTFQTPECSDPAPPEDKCATVSAVSKDTRSIVADTAEITRFDFDQSGCPKSCN